MRLRNPKSHQGSHHLRLPPYVRLRNASQNADEQSHCLPPYVRLRNDKKYILNSPLNLTYISDIANKNINTQAPDHYLKQLYSGAITDHCIPAQPNNSALKSEQEKFLKARYALIKEALEKHIGELKNKF